MKIRAHWIVKHRRQINSEFVMIVSVVVVIVNDVCKVVGLAIASGAQCSPTYV